MNELRATLLSKFEEIDEARRLLGLGESATLKEIKSAYRALAHHHHPDKNGHATRENEEMMKKLNRAYEVLIDYCNDYQYSFKEEAVSGRYSYEDDLSKWRDKWSV